MHSIEYLCKPEHMAAVRTSQSQLHRVSGRNDSGERMRRPWALTSLDLGMKTVRRPQKTWSQRLLLSDTHTVRQTIRARSRFALGGKKLLKFIQPHVPIQIVRRRLNKGQHQLGMVVQNVAAACTEDVSLMLAQPVCSLIGVDDRGIFTA